MKSKLSQSDNKNYCKVYLLRHGETEWNIKDITQGQSESLLAEVGIKQAEEAAEKLKKVDFHAIFSSDLYRALKTAEIVNSDRKLSIQTSPLLRERSYGIFEGQHASVFKNTLKDKLKERAPLQGNEYLSFELAPFIETDERVVGRLIQKIQEITTTHPNKTVLVVTHGGCIKNFLVKIGYTGGKSLPEGSFKHGGYVKLQSDGVNFIVEEAEGIIKPENYR
ncbi:MAG: histidine phosphatase family protein [Parcubacteria group bacterium]